MDAYGGINTVGGPKVTLFSTYGVPNCRDGRKPRSSGGYGAGFFGVGSVRLSSFSITSVRIESESVREKA